MIKVTAVDDGLTYEADTEDMQEACAAAAQEFSFLWPDAQNFILEVALPDGSRKLVQVDIHVVKEYHLSELDG